MKKLVLMLLAAAVVFTPAVAQADTLNVGDTVQVQAGASRYGNGGEFILFDLTNPASPASFATFCIESDEYLNFGVNLEVIGIGTAAIAGGSGGPEPDPLDERTAFIYTMYRTGNPYGWTGEVVQQAVWFIEQEITDEPVAFMAALPGLMDDHDWSGLGQVRALNIYWAGNASYTEVGDGQDLLVFVPDGGMTLMLLGGALMGLGALRRKIR